MKLEGIRVVDLSQFLPGPQLTLVMAGAPFAAVLCGLFALGAVAAHNIRRQMIDDRITMVRNLDRKSVV